MNRRDFLARLLSSAAGAAVASTLDLDKLLWVPGEKTIFLPPPPTLVHFGDIQLGDTLTFAGRYAMNPVTMKPLSHLQQFIVTGDHHGNVMRPLRDHHLSSALHIPVFQMPKPRKR